MLKLYGLRYRIAIRITLLYAKRKSKWIFLRAPYGFSPISDILMHEDMLTNDRSVAESESRDGSMDSAKAVSRLPLFLLAARS